MLETFFNLKQNNTTVRTEITAGITTFLTMVYVIFVNPAMLAQTGMDQGAVFVATCLAAAIGSIMMGVLANYPLGLAPGMGVNAFFTFGIVLGLGLSWQEALGSVFLSGVLFTSLSVLPIREWIINAIPTTLKMGISAGIGLFLAIIGLKSSGIIVDHPATLVGLGDLRSPTVLMALFGMMLTAGLYARNIKGSIIISILVITAISTLIGHAKFNGIVSMPPSIAPTFLQMELPDLFSMTTVALVLSLLLVDLFDSSGTLIGAAKQGNMLDKNGRLPRIKKALLSDAYATLIGSGLGTSTTTTYVESTAGIAVGGRTGLTAVVIGFLFLVALFFAPLAGSIPAHATAPALIFIACLMAKGAKDINWDDITDYTPSVLIMVAMPLTFSVTDGIGIGFISYVVIKIIAGKYKEVSPPMYLLSGVFLFKYMAL